MGRKRQTRSDMAERAGGFRRFPALALVAIAAVCGIVVAYAQLPPSASSAQPRLVNLNVVALDNHNQPVTDLSAADFEIADGGKRQEVAYFRHNDFRLQKAAQLGPHEFSNRAGNGPPHATLILFDLLNDTMGASGAAESQLLHSLQHLESGDDLYLYFFTKNGRLYPVRPLPGPGAQPEDGGSWTANAKPILDKAMKATFGLRPPEIDVIARVSMSYGVLETLAHQLSSIPGRKNIVWITHGVPISFGVDAVGDRVKMSAMNAADDFVDTTPFVRQLSETMDQCNVSLYPVQQTPPGMAMPGSREAEHSGLGSEDGLDQFAQLTGGRSVGGSDVNAALHQALNDVRTNYQVGFFPPEDSWDGKYHKLKVTCARKGVRIQTKAGYYAWKETKSDTEQELKGIVTNSADAGEIGLRVNAVPDAKDPQTIDLDLRIDAKEIALLRDGDHYNADLRVTLAGYNQSGGIQVGQLVPLDVHLTAAQRDEALKSGIPWTQGVKVGAPVTKLRVIVLDDRLAMAGSVTVPLDKVRAAH